MMIKVLFFAHLKDAFGTGERMLEVGEGMIVGDIVRSLFSGLKSDGLRSIPFRFAVNEELVTGDKILEDHDVLALIPPVGGG